jgi:hypothetical protein
MERALLYLLFLSVAGLVTAVFVRPNRPTALVIISIVIYVPSYIVWFALQYFHIVPVDSILRQTFGIDSYQLVGTPLGTLVRFGPPALPSIVMLCWFFLIKKRQG